LAPAANNDDFDVILFNDFGSGGTEGLGTQLDVTASRTESKNIGKYSNVSGGGIHTFPAGGKLSIGIKNVSANANVTIRYVNVWLHQI
jgi:hypothetical protein